MLISFVKSAGIGASKSALYHDTVPPSFATSGLVAAALPSTVAFLRGGGGAAASSPLLDLSREGYYLQSMSTYAVVTALVMNSALRLFTSTKFPSNKTTSTGDSSMISMMNSVKIASSLFKLLETLCIVSGVFTAIMFQLLGIYSKSALGMMNDKGYLAFKAATAVYRKWGFRCFLISLGSFVGVFLLSLYNKTICDNDGADRWDKAIFAASLLLAVLGAYHIKAVLNLATHFIFTPEFNFT
jgi:hypothetical protein